MGIQINGNNDIISALDGSWTAEGASINTSGILTATTFKGNVTGTACTFVDGNFTGSGHEFGQTGTQQIVWMDDNSTQVNIKKYDGSIIANPYLRLNIFYHTD